MQGENNSLQLVARFVAGCFLHRLLHPIRRRPHPPALGSSIAPVLFHGQIAHVRPKGTYEVNRPHPEPPQLNWAGEPIREGEGYGGRPENIPLSWKPNPEPATATEYQREAITEKDMRAVFANGPLTLSEAAKRLETLTAAHRASCYRALKLNGRFARHLHANGTRLSWS